MIKEQDNFRYWSVSERNYTGGRDRGWWWKGDGGKSENSCRGKPLPRGDTTFKPDVQRAGRAFQVDRTGSGETWIKLVLFEEQSGAHCR